MMYLASLYEKESGDKGIGFFQIGGGIAGDFQFVSCLCYIKI